MIESLTNSERRIHGAHVYENLCEECPEDQDVSGEMTGVISQRSPGLTFV